MNHLALFALVPLVFFVIAVIFARKTWNKGCSVSSSFATAARTCSLMTIVSTVGWLVLLAVEV